MPHIETERKFLIRIPEKELLSRCLVSDIVQIYIDPEVGYDTDRVRSRKYGDETVYTRTRKRHLTDASSVEAEDIITEADFYALAAKPMRGTSPIIKSRYVLSFRDYDFEIDIYDFWRDRAVMEVELPSEETKPELPPEINVIKEVTSDIGYKNFELSRHVPYENIDSE